jgi:hypothetical protein
MIACTSIRPWCRRVSYRIAGFGMMDNLDGLSRTDRMR